MRNENVGVLLGELSGGLVDIDLDSKEAIELAPYFFPSTGMIVGRSSCPRSHFFYRVRETLKAYKFTYHEGQIILEVRSDGQQTLVPPSIHPSVDIVVWRTW